MSERFHIKRAAVDMYESYLAKAANTDLICFLRGEGFCRGGKDALSCIPPPYPFASSARSCCARMTITRSPLQINVVTIARSKALAAAAAAAPRFLVIIRVLCCRTPA